MNRFKLLTQLSPWFTLLCLALAFAYAFFLYQKKAPWNRQVNWLLFGLRFVLVFLVCFLLIGPLVKYFKNFFEKPVIVFAIDNSESLKYDNDSASLAKIKEGLSGLAEEIAKADAKTEVYTFGQTQQAKDIKELAFNYPTSNISHLLDDIQSNYENKNLSAVVLVSDGIYNLGRDPLIGNYNFKIYTVGAGDTIPKKDINLKTVTYNKITYSGNQFPILAEIHHKGFDGKVIPVYLKENGKLLQEKTITLKGDEGISEITFTQAAGKKGMHRYTIETQPQKEEFTLKNNVQNAYIEVIEGKENILLLALAPHPDIKAIRSSIEQKENYRFDIYIPGITSLDQSIAYDLVILYQIPEQAGALQPIIDNYEKRATSLLYILAGGASLANFNKTNGLVKINARQSQRDNVTPFVNPAFENFKLEKEEQSIINSYPPLSVPFGEYSLSPNANILLYQKVGSTTTQKPLLVLGDNAGKKTGILCGEGVWQWRLSEYEESKSTQVFDKLFGSLLQYLSSKEDKRKFRFYPVNDEFYATDPVLFDAEVYNDVYQKVYGQKINLRITDERGASFTYSFVNTESNSRFEVKGLKEGIYNYTATATLTGNKTETASGEFTIKELLLEALNTTADYNILRELARKTGGRFFKVEELPNAVLENLQKDSFKSIIHTNEELIDLISFKTLFFIILLLASLEWFLRKYKGGY